MYVGERVDVEAEIIRGRNSRVYLVDNAAVYTKFFCPELAANSERGDHWCYGVAGVCTA